MDQFKELNRTNSYWASITDLTICEAQARAEARQMRDEYLSAAMAKLGKAIASHIQNLFSAPFRTRRA